MDFRKLLNENGVDLVIGSYRSKLQGCDQQILFDDKRRCIYAYEFGPAAKKIRLSQYLSMRHALIARDAESATPVDYALAEHGKTREIGLIVARFSTLPEVLRRAPLIATLPARLHNMFADKSVFTSSDLPFDTPDIHQGMIWRRSAKSRRSISMVRRSG